MQETSICHITVSKTRPKKAYAPRIYVGCFAIAFSVQLCVSTAAAVSTLGFEGGVNRLIQEASSGFMAIRGAKTHFADATNTLYTTHITIQGLQPCQIQVDDDSTIAPSASCTIYSGADSAKVLNAYHTIANKLNELAQNAGGSTTEHIKDGGKRIETDYQPGGGVTVRVNYQQRDATSTTDLWVDSPDTP